jgi:hypothetical protein
MSRWTGLVDAVGEADGALSFGESGVVPAQLVEWLLSHQVRTGQGSGLFQPTAEDLEERRLVTGERLKTKLATTHILSQESARILHTLGGADPAVAAAVALTTGRLRETCYALQHCTIGECAASFIGYVRFMWAVLGEAAAPEITWRLRTLSEHRDGTGRWKRFPTYYTLLVLSEIPLPAVRDELVYAKPVWTSSPRAAPLGEVYIQRRRRLQENLADRGGGLQPSHESTA